MRNLSLVAKTGTETRELNVKEAQNLLYRKYQTPFGDGERLRELGII